MKVELTITDDADNVQQYDVIGLLRFIKNNYTYEYSKQVNTWGYKHKKRGWHIFGNVYTENEVIEDFVRNNSL